MNAIALTVKSAPWSEDSAFWIGQTQQHATTEEIRNQVDAGVAQLFELIDENGDMRGAFVLRIDKRNIGPEGVILSAAGNVPGVDLIAVLLEHIESRLIDCVSIRLHTANPVLARRMAVWGYGVSELVCKKEKKHAHN